MMTPITPINTRLAVLAMLLFTTVFFRLPVGKRLVERLADKMTGGNFWTETLGWSPITTHLLTLVLWSVLTGMICGIRPEMCYVADILLFGGIILLYHLLIFGSMEIVRCFIRRR